MGSFAAFMARRLARACLLVLTVASAAVLLVHLAPGDAVSGELVDPALAAAERGRLGLDRPFASQYIEWLGRALVLDFGHSYRFQRPVADLLFEGAGFTLLLGAAALVVALGLGLPAGVVTGQQRGDLLSRSIAALSLLLLSTPPLVTALLFLLVAARTGWFPTGGLGVTDTGISGLVEVVVRYLPLPALALGLPLAASLERVQSQAITEALKDPSVVAAQSRGLPASRVIWVHAWRLSLRPVLGILGIVVGSVLSGSLAVEAVMTWPGLSHLMIEALIGQDLNLAAGCAALGAALLSIGLLAADLALASADPAVLEPT